MKKMLYHLSTLRLFVMPAAMLLLCSWENPGMYNYANRISSDNNVLTDTIPGDKGDELEQAMKKLDKGINELDKKMDEVKTALASIDYEAIQKKAEESFKQINWRKIQQEASIAMQQAQKQIAEIDFAKMQNEMKTMQDKLASKEFKSQLNSEKLHKEIKEAMRNAKTDMEKAKEKLLLMKTFINALAADGLIDKKKGYVIEWKNGDLYINNQKQPKEIADKYRRYERGGKIKMLPEGAEHF